MSKPLVSSNNFRRLLDGVGTSASIKRWIQFVGGRNFGTASDPKNPQSQQKNQSSHAGGEKNMNFTPLPTPSLPGSDVQPVRWLVPPAEDGSRLDRFIKRRAPGLPPGLIQKTIRLRKVQVNSDIANHNAFKVYDGDQVRFPGHLKLGLSRGKRKPPKDDVSLAEAQIVRSWVLHRDARAIVINKPPGLPVSPKGPSFANPLLLELESKRTSGKGIRLGSGNGPLGLDSSRCVQDLLSGLGGGRYWLVHQIDKEVAGALVIARDVGAAGLLAEFFRTRLVRKTYWALVYGSVKLGSGSIQTPIDGKLAYTSYRVLQRVDKTYTWIALYPRTGRKHQLRIHCSQGLGCPIVGDGRYNGDCVESRNLHADRDSGLLDQLVPDGGMHLMSRRIEYPVLTEKSVGSQRKSSRPRRYVGVTAPLPSHMRDTWKRLGLVEKIADAIEHPDIGR